MLSRVAHNQYFDMDRFAHLLARYRWLQPGVLLPAYFLLVSFTNLSRSYAQDLGIDATIYYRAAAAFAEGASPWAAVVTNTRGTDFHFAALPPTVLAFLPFTLVTEQLAVWLWIFSSAVAAVSIVRRFGLPIWWLAFPPMAQGVIVANPQIVLLALLLSGSSLLAAAAPALKIYAIAPLVGERRVKALLITAALLVGSIAVAPGLWAEYLIHSGEISDRLLLEAHGGYSAPGQSAVLTVATIVGLALLAVVDFRAAGWLAAPAVVPGSQFHLSTMAMPVMARTSNLLLIVLFALPIRGLPSAVVAIYGAWRCYEGMRRRRLTGDLEVIPGPATPPPRGIAPGSDHPETRPD